MADLDDHGLLARFARENDDAAFGELTQRYVNLVYSAALRQTGNAHAAEEITQAVFIILARKAGSLGPKTILSGWLYQTARLTAANYLRTEARRVRREQEAFMLSQLDEPQFDETWQRIAPLLDDALGKLGERDRNAIVLRFFESKSLGEVGATLGASEDAAKMRVTRALEKLRKIFTKRGVTLTATLIAGAVSANSVQAAPVGLTVTVATTAAKGTLISATITTLVKGTMKTMTWLKLKFAFGVGVTVLVVGGVATVALRGAESDSAVSSAFQLRLVYDAVSTDSETLTYGFAISQSGKRFEEPLHVQKKVLLDLSAIDSVSVSTNSLGRWQIDFVLTPKGKEKFRQVTRDNVGRRLAIIIDGKVVAAPVINSEIPGGKGQISGNGNFTEAEAKDFGAKISKSTAR